MHSRKAQRGHEAHVGSPTSGLAKLPEELIQKITDLLNPNDTFRCRSVSRYWYQVFTGPVVMKRALVSDNRFRFDTRCN